METRVCTKCNEEKPISEYNTHNGKNIDKNGIEKKYQYMPSYCKSCEKAIKVSRERKRRKFNKKKYEEL